MDFKKLQEQKIADEHTFYLLIAGSRGFHPHNFNQFGMTNQRLADKLITKIIQKRIDDGFSIKVYEGEAPGADQVGKNYAVEHGHEYKGFIADWDKLGKKAGYKRNDKMYLSLSLKKHKGAILFWDGESKGTLDNFYRAKKYGVSLRCFNYVKGRFLSAEEISLIQDILSVQYAKYEGY